MNTEINANWILKIVDTGGYFNIDIIESKNSKLGYRVVPEFSIIRNEDDEGGIACLHSIRDFFGHGFVRPLWPPYTYFYKYHVRKLKTLNTVIVPFFRANKLLSNRLLKETNRAKLSLFEEAIFIMEQRGHLTESGLDKIIKIKDKMFIEDSKGWL